jgi:hypothetical protein
MRFGRRRPLLEKQVPSNSNDDEEVAYRTGTHQPATPPQYA